MLHELDPLLVQCIQILTKPARERRRLFSHQDFLDSSGDVKIKSMKQLYCLSTLLFCTNSQCNMPLQYLLADAILCLGGSTELLKIFNRIGAVASLDTHDRIAMYAVTERITKGIYSELVPRTLTISSIDNIDILQRHGMVSAVQSKRSWHGTSVQCVQPMPKSIRSWALVEHYSTSGLVVLICSIALPTYRLMKEWNKYLGSLSKN